MAFDPISITGMGPVCAVGDDAKSLWQAALCSHSGTTAMSRFQVGPRQCAVAAQVAEPAYRDLDALNPVPRAMQMAIPAAEKAWRDAGVASGVSPDRVGVVVGTGLGMTDLVENVGERSRAGKIISPIAGFRGFCHAITCELVRRMNIRGPQATVSDGCNSGLCALGLAVDWIRLGKADCVLAGGVEAEITPGFWAAMGAARALCGTWNHEPLRASRPFDRNRGGNVPGEGAAFVIIERESCALARGTIPIARILGWASLGSGTRPVYDPFNPVFDTVPLRNTMRAALEDAGLSSDQVGAVSANGSASVFYDPLEAAAIREQFGANQPPVHSIKGALGQTGAVTPVLQTCVAALSVQAGLIPPTVNCDDPDPACDIDIVRNSPRAMNRGPTVVLNAIGFGGHYNGSMVIAACSGTKG